MTPRTSFTPASEPAAAPGMRVVVLHDDHVTANRGAHIAHSIADEMGLGVGCETKFWNIELLDTLFGRVAAVDASTADILILALRGSIGFGLDLKVWLGRWLFQARHTSAALITVFENNDEPAARESRAFIERAARTAGKDFFCQSGDFLSDESTAHEFLWVL